MAHFVYGGETYEVRDEDLDGLMTLIVDKANGGQHAWVKVRAVAGAVVEILIGPGTEIAVYRS